MQSTDRTIDYNGLRVDVRMNQTSRRVEEGETLAQLQDTLLYLEEQTSWCAVLVHPRDDVPRPHLVQQEVNIGRSRVWIDVERTRPAP